jgi:hypothetical protein
MDDDPCTLLVWMRRSVDVMCIWRLTESDKIARLITFQVAGIRIYLT